MMLVTTKVLGTSLIALVCGSLLLTAPRAAAQTAPAPRAAAPAATSPGAGPVDRASKP